MKNDGNFTKFKRVIAFASGVWVGYASIFLSRKGIGFADDLNWMAWGIAIALFCAEFMFNSQFDELSWTLILIGAGAYIYSIGVNIGGFYFYRGIPGTLWTNFNLTNFSGGMFMDIYPEIAIAWALKESKVGDFLGNLLKAYNDPNKLIQQVNGSQAGKNPNQQSYQSHRVPTNHNLPRHQTPQVPNKPQQPAREEELPEFLRQPPRGINERTRTNQS
jgi:hypothetical protein